MPVLQFKGKTVVENYHHTVPHHTLEFDPKLSVLPKGEAAGLEGNLIIEGDNLLALKALLPTHAGRIKCIYIDPPYNTGDEGWVFNDNLTQPQFTEWVGQTVGKEGEDACRHDKWCCMMYPRLALLRELLSENGVLFASIDENEAGLLRLLLDEVFRAEKPLATFVWKRRSPTGMRAEPVSVDHEYVLAYAKDPDHVDLTGTVMTEADYPLEDDIGRFASTDLTVGMSREERPNQFYTLVNPETKKEYAPNPDRVWRFEPNEMKRVIKEKLVIWPEDHLDRKMKRPRFKTRFDPDDPKIKPVSSWIYGKGRVQDEEDEDNGDEGRVLQCGLNSEGGRILRQMFEEKVFNYPKPPSLIQSLVSISTGDGDIILDSFAGSGTSGEAVLRANSADNQKRRFILVQQPYDTKKQEAERHNICAAVTAPRVKKVIAGYEYGNANKKKKVPGVEGSFTYARVGRRLFGEYKVWEKEMPQAADLAKYIFYTETNHEFDAKQWQKKTGRLGEHKGTAYYLLYAAGGKNGDRLDTKWLASVGEAEKCKRLVVYCEKIWLHREDREKWEQKTGKSLRPMQLPMGLK